MRGPEHKLNRLLRRVQDVHWQVEPGRNRRRYKTNSPLPGIQTKPARQQTKSTMQVEFIETKRLPPPSAFHHPLHPRERSTASTILLTLSLVLVLFSVAFANRFTTISAATIATTANHNHNHNLQDHHHLNHKHHHHQQHQQHNHLKGPEHSSYRNSDKHRKSRRLKDLNSRGNKLERSPRHLQEQRRLRNLIAKTSSSSILPGVQHHRRATEVRDKSSPLHQQLPPVTVQNLIHSRRRYRFYDNEIQYPKASRHFGSVPHLGARLRTTTDQDPYGFPMHEDFKFWDDQYGDELNDVDSLDVDLDEDGDDDEGEDDDNDDDDDDDVDVDDDNLIEDQDDEVRVPSQVDGNEENTIASHAKYSWKGFSIHGAHHNGRLPKTRYHAKYPGHRDQESSPVIAQAHYNAIKHGDDRGDLSGLHASSKKPLTHSNRHHKQGQPIQLATEQRVSQVPYQSPIVVSISDNSFVSASPPVLVGPDTNREEQQQQQQPDHKRNAIDTMATDAGDRPTTGSIYDDTLERDHVLASNISGSDTVSLLNITAYNRVETSTSNNLFISDHDDGLSRHRKVHLLQPPARGNTFNNLIDNDIRYSRISQPSMADVGVYTTQADRIDHYKKKEIGSRLVVNGYVPPEFATNGRTTYRYELELIATTTPPTNIPTTIESAHKSLNNNKTDGGNGSTSADDDNVDDHQNDEDETDKNDDDEEEDDIDLDEDDENSLTIDSVELHPKSEENSPDRYSHIIASPNNELPSYVRQYWHTPHRASIQLVQEKPDGLRRGSINSAIIAILFGIGATGMLIMIVSIKMGSIRERVAYKGRRRSLVPDTDFLINTIPI